MQYSYDNYERLAQENRDGDITSYTYNLAGQLTEITDTTGKYTYYYDSIGRVTRMVYPDGGNLKPVYDKDNRLTAVHTNLGGTQRTTGYTYLLDGRLSQTTLPTGKTVTYSYDPLARLSGSGIDGVLSSSYTYESPGEGKTTPLVSSVITNGKETEYTYDAFGNILTITEDGVLQHSYTYDARNQLVGETSGTDSYVYSYDAGGNLVSVQKNGEVIKSYTYGDASWKDLLTAFNGQSITYDAIGNPLSYRGMTLSWAGGRRLASVSKEGLSASYVYNTDGIRTQKTVNGVTTNYYLDGSSVLRQVTGNDVLEFFYDANGVLGFYYNNTPHYYLKNLQGDIVGILDANGTQVVSYTYDAWGAPLSVTGTAADTIGQLNPFRYRSYYYDNETGLYYLNSRYYDPETYRFLNADGIYDTRTGMLSHNMFAYCNNNPVNMVDSTGMGPLWEAAKTIFRGAANCVINYLVKKTENTKYSFLSRIHDAAKRVQAGIDFGQTVQSSQDAKQRHAANVVNAGASNSSDVQLDIFDTNIITDEIAYQEHCKAQYKTMLYFCPDAKGIPFEDLTPEQQKTIVDTMPSWDFSFTFAIGLAYAAYAIFDIT